MDEIFQFLFKYRPALYEKGTIGFHPLWAAHLTWIFIGTAIAIVYFLYRRTVHILPRNWRLALSALRAAAFMILLLIFQQPVLRLHTAVPQENFVAIAFDVSRSMEIRDGPGGKSRMEVAKQLFGQPGSGLVADLARRFKVRWFCFSRTAERVEGFTELVAHGAGTDLQKSLEKIAAELADVPLAGIILVTDGADNRSRDLQGAAARLAAQKIPVYSIGIGSSDPGRDLEIVGVAAPEKILQATAIEAQVAIRARGYAGRKTRLSIYDQDRLVQAREIALERDAEVKNYELVFGADSAGPRIFKFRLEPFPDEAISRNNDQVFLINITNEQAQILYVEGEPRWEYAFLRRAVAGDENLRLVGLLRQAEGKFLRQGVESPAVLEKGFPVDKPELFRYKALILGSVEASFFTFDQLRLISDFVGQRGGSFLMLGGRNSFAQGGYINTPVEDILPVELVNGPAGQSEFLEQEFTARPTMQGWQHPVTRISRLEEENRRRWEAAPVLVGMNPTVDSKPGATVLLRGQLLGERDAGKVLLAYQRFGRGKSLALTTGSTWRWRMGLDHEDNFHQLFWRQLLRWMVGDVSEAVSLTVERNSYPAGDDAVFHLEARDPSFMPINSAVIKAQVRSPSGQMDSLDFVWDVEKDGFYSASYRFTEEGIHEIDAEAFQGGKSLGSAKTYVLIGESTDEFRAAALNSNLLSRLSERTGGRYYSPDNLRYLAEDISYVPTGPSQLQEKDLWDMPFLFLLLVGLISTEWALRRRKGLA